MIANLLRALGALLIAPARRRDLARERRARADAYMLLGALLASTDGHLEIAEHTGVDPERIKAAKSLLFHHGWVAPGHSRTLEGSEDYFLINWRSIRECVNGRDIEPGEVP